MPLVCYGRQHHSTAFSVQEKTAIVTLTNVVEELGIGIRRIATGIASFIRIALIQQGEKMVWMEGMADLLLKLKA